MLGLTATAETSALACVPCARSKARCDRKVPCTRCVLKKLTCRARVSKRRGAKDSPNINNAQATRFQVDNDGSGRGTRETTHGIWMDWSLRFDAVRTVSQSSQGLAQAGPRGNYGSQFLAQLVSAAAAAADDAGTSLSQFLPTPADLQHFIAPNFSLAPCLGAGMNVDSSPDALLASLAPCLGAGMNVDSSPDALLASLSHGEATDGHVPAASTLPRRMEPPSVDSETEALESWPLFRCNPAAPSSSSTSNPTGPSQVKKLSALLRDVSMSTTTNTARPSGSSTAVEPLLAGTRETLTAVLQGLFHEAQQLYGFQSSPDDGLDVLTLPPPSEMDFLLRAAVDCYAPHYPAALLTAVEVNERIGANRATATLWPSAPWRPAPPGRILRLPSAVDICRISLHKLVERNVQLASDPEFMQCALLLVIAMVWSGDKRLMEMGMYHKAMYLEMHLRASLHASRDDQLARLDTSADAPHRCEILKSQGMLNRATYSWLVLDYELRLFQDTPATSFLSVANLDLPMPSFDVALSAASPGDSAPNAGQHTLNVARSIKDWVARFTDANDTSTMGHVSPHTLRILLCHLADQVLHLRSRIDGLCSTGNQTHHHLRRRSRRNDTPTAALLSMQMREVQGLLKKWFDLAETRRRGPPGGDTDTSTAVAAAHRANAVIYHLTMLSTMVSFPEIERLARRGPDDARAAEAARAHTHHQPHHHHHLDPDDAREIAVHCGQALRSLRGLTASPSGPSPAPPLWWAAAVYRAVLVAWANSANMMMMSQGGSSPAAGSLLRVQLDALPARYDAAVLSDPDPATGEAVSLAEPKAILRYGVRLLELGVQSAFAQGVRLRLMAMARRWEDV
ncbi:uncharacterized protein THITE_2083982 [Thermothielavioides terrestris NRRL 8126]|uniref:Zn(2)-C6 fungal-type domain-containing protein n=1 Tax=Thermothielavioides terrestris (strain ATCC 38088 / NRRL 8126) TaxID=578455 RepID=G2QR08_THETT|nr:uncharacterized protein THITE_2083982 [Thermothielavioides terrestris NRRL 8126]AEO62460.1 hypothetical protein THITE_2083982 [Thermothielavioides terrestris NRRL 8126]